MDSRVGLIALLAFAAACSEDETPRDFELLLGTASVSASADPPDGLAALDATAQLEATVDLRGATVIETTIQSLPEGPDSMSLTFEVNVRGPQDASSLDLPANEIVVARISNAGSTNAELQPFCGRAVSLQVVVEAEGIERTAERQLTVTCS